LKNDKMKLKRPLKKSEKILIIFFFIALVAVFLRWKEIKDGVSEGWKHYNIIEWFSREN